MRSIHVYIAIPILFIFFGCKQNSTSLSTSEPTPVPFTEVQMECTDLVSMSSKLEATIRSQGAYESYIFKQFTIPLRDYWNANYESVLNSMKQRYPGLSDTEYEALVREVFYSILPFRGTDSCCNPVIDFDHYTLLGYDAHAGGCRTPDYQITVLQDENKKEIIYKIKIIQHGYCLMAFSRNKWILIPKISPSYRIVFQKEYLYLPQ
jgi:hypothetical protein